MPSLNMMIGNIGSGKSFIASKLAKRDGMAVFCMDELQTMLSGGEYGHYNKDWKNIYHDMEEKAIESCLSNGVSLVIDRTNMDKKRRARFIEIGKKHGAEISALVCSGDADDMLKRRISNSRGVPESVWKEVFAFMQNSYETPTEKEGFSSVFYMPERFIFHAFDFDGTIVENKFPDIGEIIDGTVEKMNQLYSDLSNVNIIWTCRNGDYVNQIAKFMNTNGILYDFINENPLYELGGRKIFAHKYYDDRNAE